MKKLLKKISGKFSIFNFQFSISKGFTLIELLVVIAVLGVLAAIVLLAVNPAEQLARGRDTSRISAITQVGRALQAYYTANNATYPPACTAAPCTWMQPLITSQDLKVAPTNPTYGGSITACNSTTLNQNGYCYNTSSTETIVYARLESTLYNNSKCTAPAVAYWAFSAGNARAGGICGAVATDPGVAAVTTFNF